METGNRERLTKAVRRLAMARDDQRAWETLFAASLPNAPSTTHRVLRGQLELAEDAAQDAFHRVVSYAKFNAFADGDAFLAYLHIVARNTARDVLRGIAAGIGDPPAVQVDLEVQEAARENPEDLLRGKELENQIMAGLHFAERRTLELMLAALGPADIAHQLRVSYSTAGVRIHRLRSKIRKYLQTREL